MRPDVPVRIVGDPTRLRQVIINLVGNATKFTERGEVSLKVEVDQRTEHSVFLRFSISDTGIGVPIDKQQAIFEAFSQADVSTTRRFGGTGLGLAISARLVQLMDGKIWLESQPGQGAVFTFTGRFGVEVAAQELPAQARYAGRRALVIDDNLSCARYLVELLDRLGIQASLSADGVAAVEAIERSREVDFPYDYIVADANMDAPAGFALAEAWGRSGCKERLVVMLTTENQRHDLARSREIGVSAHLVKPIGAPDLADALALAEGKGGVELDAFVLSEVDFGRVATEEAGGFSVLLVEDNPVNQELAKRLLERESHRVTIANNGAEAVDLFDSGHFDVILMDLQMPVLDGLDATRQIRKMVDKHDVPIIALTASAMPGDRERCLGVGMNGYVTKPVSKLDLYNNLLQWVKSSGGEPKVPIEVKPPALMGVLDLEDALRRLEHDREALQILFKLFLSEHKDDLWDIRTALRRQQPEVACRLLHTLKGVSANISASRLQLLAGELEWRLRLQEELSEGELNQLQQVFTQTREEVSHFLLTGEQQESVAFPFSPPDKRL